MSYKVQLEVFEGPLDLLLYLIKEEELNIYDIPITRITGQYLEYLNLMEMLDLDIAGEFLVMAATLMQIKSKMLLPADPTEPEEEEDPRAQLVRRLLEYKAFKEVSGTLREYEDKRSGIFPRFGVQPELDPSDMSLGDVSIFQLLTAFSKVLKNFPKQDFHEVGADEFTISDKVHEIFHRLVKEPIIKFSALFRSAKNKMEAITIFLAVLEMIRLREILVRQDAAFEEIEIERHIKDETASSGPKEISG